MALHAHSDHVKAKFTVFVKGHHWSSARHLHETLQEFAQIIEKNGRRLGFIGEKDRVERLQLARADGSEPEELDVDATLEDVLICKGNKQLVAVILTPNLVDLAPSSNPYNNVTWKPPSNLTLVSSSASDHIHNAQSQHNQQQQQVVNCSFSLATPTPAPSSREHLLQHVSDHKCGCITAKPSLVCSTPTKPPPSELTILTTTTTHEHHISIPPEPPSRPPHESIISCDRTPPSPMRDFGLSASNLIATTGSAFKRPKNLTMITIPKPGDSDADIEDHMTGVASPANLTQCFGHSNPLNHGETILSPNSNAKPSSILRENPINPTTENVSPMLCINNASMPSCPMQSNQGLNNSNNNVFFTLGGINSAQPPQNFIHHDISCNNVQQTHNNIAPNNIMPSNMLSKFNNPNIAAILAQILASQLGAFMPSDGCIGNQSTSATPFITSAMVNDTIEKFYTNIPTMHINPHRALNANLKNPSHHVSSQDMHTPADEFKDRPDLFLAHNEVRAYQDNTYMMNLNGPNSGGVENVTSNDHMEHAHSGIECYRSEKDQSSSSAIDAHHNLDTNSQVPEMVFLVNRRSKTGRGTHRLKMSELSSYFHLSVVDAAKKLGVSQTTLKKACRKFGLKRWPGRKVRSLESTINGLEHTIAVGQGAGMEELTEAQIRSEVLKLQQEMDHLVHGLPSMQHPPTTLKSVDLYKRICSRGWKLAKSQSTTSGDINEEVLQETTDRTSKKLEAIDNVIINDDDDDDNDNDHEESKELQEEPLHDCNNKRRKLNDVLDYELNKQSIHTHTPPPHSRPSHDSS